MNNLHVSVNSSESKFRPNFFLKKAVTVSLVFIFLIFSAYLYSVLFKANILDLIGLSKTSAPVSSEDQNTYVYTQDSPFAKIGLISSNVVLSEEVAYNDKVGLPRNENGNIDFYYVNVNSSGNVYSRNITINDGTEITLLILEGYLENGLDVDVIVGIYGGKFFNKPLSNWWLNNMFYRNNIENGLNERPTESELVLTESNLEQRFKKDSIWKYTFYFDNKIKIPDEYKNILDTVYSEKDLISNVRDLERVGSTDVILMPF